MSNARVKNRLPGDEQAALFAALGDASRLQLVSRLSAEGPLSIVRLSEGAGISRQAVTKHLHVLAEAGIVSGARNGRERIWQLTPLRLQEAHRYLDLVSDEWDAALQRLKHFVED